MTTLPYRTADAPPKARLPLLDEVTVKTPCKVSWNAMEGDDRMRFCCTCSKNVYDLSAMTEDEAESFLAVNLDDDERRVRLYRRPDGRLLTSDCPVGGTKRHRRQVAVAASAAAVAITAVSAAVGDLHVPRAHSPRHNMHSRFEPPRRIPGDSSAPSTAPAFVPVLPLDYWGRPAIDPQVQDFEYALGNVPSPDSARRGARRSPTLRQGAVYVMANYPPEVVTRIVRQNFGRVRLCYEDGLSRDAQLAGRVTTRFVIGREGSVAAAEMADSSVGDRAMIACVVRAFGNLSFPRPGQDAVTVMFPIVFSPGD